MKVKNYMAILRNINNIDKVGISDKHWKKILKAISDPMAVKYSKQLPFRFYSVIKNTQVSDPFKRKELEASLTKALNYSVDNLQPLPGRTYIACDSSGSMTWAKVSKMSNATCAEVGCLFGALTYKLSDNAILGLFDTNLKVYTTLPSDVLTATNELVRACQGGSTNGYLTIKYLLEKGIVCDRIIMFTDMELYGGSLQTEITKYRKNINPEFKVYIIDLSSSGDCAINPRDKNTFLMSGWSDRILQFISMHEKGTDSFVKTIDNYKGK